MATDHHVEFHCVSCGRHIISLGDASKAPECGLCDHMPGWFRNPELRAVMDPGHTGNPLDHFDPNKEDPDD